jgi:hypothetical protein
MRARKLEVTFNASGAAEAGARGRVVAIIDVVDASTSAEAAQAAVAEPRVGPDERRRAISLPVLQALTTAGVRYELAANQGAELPGLVNVERRIVVLVSSTGGTAFDAALAAGAPAACFLTTARVTGRTGWDMVGVGARRAIALADEHGADLAIVAASANSADDVLAAFEISRRVITEGFLRL